MNPASEDNTASIHNDEIENVVDENQTHISMEQEKFQTQITTLEQKILQIEQEKKEMSDKYLRMYADFENYRKRMIKERSDTIFSAQRNLLFEILPVLDDLERAMNSIERSLKKEENLEISFKTLQEGIQLVCKQFAYCLSKIGLEPINAKGKPFDPTIHEAIQFIPVPMVEGSAETELVLEEMVKGYKMQERLLRPSKVVVSKPEILSKPASENGESEKSHNENVAS